MLSLIRRAFGPLLLTLVIAAVATILLARNAGWESMVVTTGSMDPTYPAGALIAAEPPTGEEQVGDVIVFLHPDARDVRVTHRITGIEPGGYVTQGDANEDPDPWTVPTDDVLGVVRGGVPGVGLAMTKFRTGPWPWMLASGILAAEALRQFRRSDDEEEGEVETPEPKGHGTKAIAGLSVFALVSGASGLVGSTVAAFWDHAAFQISSTSACWDIDDDTTADEDESVDDDTLDGEDDTSCDDDTSVDVDEDSSSDDVEDGEAETESQQVQRESAEYETPAENSEGGRAAPAPSSADDGTGSPEPTEGEEPEPAEGAEEPEGETTAPEPDPEPEPGESPDDAISETDEDEHVATETPEGEPEPAPAPSESGERG